MRYTILPLALAATVVSHAQITIGPADMPSAGDTVRYTTTVAPDIQMGFTGNGITWDFSDLVPGIGGADTVVAVTSTPILYQFFFNNPFLYPANQAGYAVRGPSMDLQVVQVQNVYEYFKADGTSHRNVGFGATINSLPASVRRNPVDHVYRFPLNYTDLDTSFSAFELEVPTLGFLREEQWRYNNVDGWGTLLLPGGSFDVLRVVSTLHRRDSVYIAQIGMGFAVDQPETVEYKWLAPGMDLPVLQVVAVGGVPTSVRYYNEVVTSVSGMEGANGLPHLYPNPCLRQAGPGSGTVAIHLPDGWDGHLHVIDAAGRTVSAAERTVGGRTITLPVNGLAAGLHLVRFQGPNGTWSGRLIVE